MAEPATPLHAIAPDGREVQIRPEKAAQAAEAGYKIQTPDEFAASELEKKEGLAGSARTFAESAASGASLGLYDVAAGAIGGDEYRRDRALRELASPIAATSGQVTGMVLPALIPGGAVAGAARGVAEGAEAASLLGRAGELAAGAARYSPAGLAIRGGEAVSGLVGRGLEAAGFAGEGVLGRAASSGLRMAAGGAAEGAAYGAGQALSEAALAPGGDYDSLAQKLWAGAIHGAEFGALGGGAVGVGGELAAGVARKIGGSFSARKLVQDLADEKTLRSIGLSKADVEALGAKRAQEIGDIVRGEQEIGTFDSLGTRSKKIKSGAENAEATLDASRKGLDEMRAPSDGVDVHSVLNQWEQRATELKSASKSVHGDKLADSIAAEVKRFRESFPEEGRASFEAAHELRKTLDEELRQYRDTRPAGARADRFETEMMHLGNDVEKEFQASADRVMQNATPEFREQYAAANARHSALTEASELSSKRVAELAGNQNLEDMLIGAAGYASLGPKGLLLAAAKRVARSAQGDAVIGHLAAGLAKLDDRVGSSMAKWGSAARKGAVQPASFERIAGRARSVATTSGRQVSEIGAQYERNKQYFAKLDAVERESKSPPGTLVHIPDSPKTQAAAESVRRRQAAWLLSEAPASPAQIKNPIMARLARQTAPNPSEVATWLLKVKTVEDPESALVSFEKGQLRPAQVKALEQTPAVLEKFRQAALAQVTDSNSDISYEARMQLGILLGVVTDPSLRPESIALSQQTYAAMRQEAAQAQQGPPAPSAQGKPPTRGASSRIDEMEEGAI